MTDHRRLQRALFRMQADAGFARAVLAGDDAALASAALSGEDLALLETVDADALAADPGDRRRTQIAGNAASEYFLTLAVAARMEGGQELLHAFLSAPEFHEALATLEGDKARLPLAFGDYALRWAAQRSLRELAALATLESDMARLRRAVRAAAPEMGAGEVQLSPAASVVELPGGTLEWSVRLREALDASRPIPAPALAIDALETILLRVAGEPHPHRLNDVVLELLEPPADALLLRARTALPHDERADFARANGAEPEELESFLKPLIAEGVLVAGSS